MKGVQETIHLFAGTDRTTYVRHYFITSSAGKYRLSDEHLIDIRIDGNEFLAIYTIPSIIIKTGWWIRVIL